MNLPNKLTVFRVLLVPFFMVFLLLEKINFNLFFALIIFIIASVTDLADGYIARKYNLITSFGKFLDPLADKILVISALVSFIELRWIKAWPVMIIIAREFIVSAVRLTAVSGKDNVIIPAGILGKLKTASTMIAIVLILIFRAFKFNAPVFLIIGDALIYICVFLTAWSGIDYLFRFRHVFK